MSVDLFGQRHTDEAGGARGYLPGERVERRFPGYVLLWDWEWNKWRRYDDPPRKMLSPTNDFDGRF